LKYIKLTYGPDEEQRFLNELSEKHRNVLTWDGCKALWYPFSLYKEISEKAMEMYSKGDFQFLRKVGAYTAEHDERVITKLFFKMGTPSVIVRLGTWAYQRYFNEGALEIIESSPGSVVFRITKISVIDPVMYERIAGWMEKAIELSGGKNPKTDVKISEYKGSEEIVFYNSWE
jgi:hypothetical protein